MSSSCCFEPDLAQNLTPIDTRMYSCTLRRGASLIKILLNEKQPPRIVALYVVTCGDVSNHVLDDVSIDVKQLIGSQQSVYCKDTSNHTLQVQGIFVVQKLVIKTTVNIFFAQILCFFRCDLSTNFSSLYSN